MALLAAFGAGLLVVSLLFLAIHYDVQKRHFEEQERFSQPGYEQCLHCTWHLPALQQQADLFLMTSVLLVAAGVSLFIITIPSSRKVSLR